MSTLTNTDWKSHSHLATSRALPLPDTSEVSVMREKAIAFRDTLIVVAIQLVFRASLAMRRWNY
jgi:hypothetical protein